MSGDGLKHKPDEAPAMFDAIADRYDRLNRILSLGVDRRWRRTAVEALALRDDADAQVLDVGTGTADVAIEICRRHPRARVTGIDRSQKMLNLAADKVGECELGERIGFRTASVLELPFDDDAFDAAVVAFGMRAVADRPRALAEMARAVRPGGRVVVLDLSLPRRAILESVSRGYFTRVLPAIGSLLSQRAAYTFLPATVVDFPPRNDFVEMMVAAGLVLVAWRDLTGGIATIFWGEKAPSRERAP